jgi:para-nitrobenzyl esterase
MDEDCLHLTITAPARAINEGLQLPVMVFLHGGANVSGGGDLDCYLSDSLIRKDIVVVNVSYRLGIFGWVPMEGKAPANLGLLDQIEALRWVQKNISHFGGCPQHVTIIGHSVGAYVKYCMMVADTATGLFHRAILQSTPFEWQTVSARASDDLAKIA